MSEKSNNVIEGRFGANARRRKNKRSSLCENGHHGWVIEKDSVFDVKAGKLVTVKRCKRCGLVKNQLT